MPDAAISSSSSAGPSYSSSNTSSQGSAGSGGHLPPVNEGLRRDATKAEQIALQAQVLAHVQPLSDNGAPPTVAVEILALVEQARGRGDDAVEDTVGKEGATDEETAIAKALVDLLQDIQTAAKLKFRSTDKKRLKLYRIGSKARLDQSRPDLEANTKTILDLADVDDLSNVGPAKIASGRALLAQYKQKKVTQTNAQGDASTDRIDVKTLRALLNSKRGDIQLAADRAWPHTKPASAPFRRKFQIPIRMRYKG